MMILFRNLTLILENTPFIRRFAGAIFVYGQKPPRSLPRPTVQMTEHIALHGAVSVVVPCYNEEMNVGPLVEGLLKHYDEYIHEIILVDDNSKDRTPRGHARPCHCRPARAPGISHAAQWRRAAPCGTDWPSRPAITCC